MSSVPKSRRKEHDFIAAHKLRSIRNKITELAINDFGYDQDRFEKKIEKYENSLRLEEEKKTEVVARMRKKNEDYYKNFVEEETKETRNIIRKVVYEFELGNSIFPSGNARFEEYCERRLHFDNAVGWLHCLKQELQYIAETLPGDKNKYVALSNEIEEEVALIKGLRRAANKFLKKDDTKKKELS